jgi:hypothetical protein
MELEDLSSKTICWKPREESSAQQERGAKARKKKSLAPKGPVVKCQFLVPWLDKNT